MNCLLVAGEKSGEDHVLTFLSKLQTKLPHLQFWGVGGDQLAQRNVELLYHLKDFSSMGFSEVIAKILFYKRAENLLIREAKKRRCRVAILIDFQTFNLRLAKKLKKEGLAILYYVAPQAWAWKSYRAKILQKSVHTLFTILPFEKDWFQKRGVQRVKSTIHPLILTYEKKKSKCKLSLEKKPHSAFQKQIRILLLPGSRNSEIEKLLHPFMRMAFLPSFQDLPIQWGLVTVDHVKEDLYAPSKQNIMYFFSSENLDVALEWADLAVAASGTVTLASALFEVPTVVAYKLGLFDEFVFKNMIRYSGFVSLANIIHQKKLFPEFLHEQCTSYNLGMALLKWISDQKAYEKIKRELSQTWELFQGEKNIGGLMAKIINEIYRQAP